MSLLSDAANRALQALWHLEDELDASQLVLSEFDDEVLAQLERRWEVDTSVKIARERRRAFGVSS